MANALALTRLLPLPFFGRLTLAFLEIVIAGLILSGSVVVGHWLAEWHAWYGDPATEHPWAPSPKPTPVIEVDGSR